MNTSNFLRMRLVFLLLALFSVSASLASPATHAQPTSFDCTTGCHSEQYWNGTSWGFFGKFTISNPTFHTSPAYWNRFIRLSYGSSYPRLEVGVSKTVKGGFGDYCGGAGDGLHYFIYNWDQTRFNNYNYCAFVPQIDINSDVLVEAFFDGSCNIDGGSPDEMRVYIQSGNFSTNQCADTEASSNTRITDHEDMVDDVVGHEVWGSRWTLQEWIDSTIVAHYQTRPGDDIIPNNPPQMFWHTIPASGNNGGVLYSCDYDSGTSCTYGS